MEGRKSLGSASAALSSQLNALSVLFSSKASCAKPSIAGTLLGTRETTSS